MYRQTSGKYLIIVPECADPPPIDGNKVKAFDLKKAAELNYFDALMVIESAKH